MADTAITVTSAAISIGTPDVYSDREGSLTAGAISFAGGAIALALSMGLTSAPFEIAGKVINLSVTGSTLSVSVGTALPTIQGYNVGGIAQAIFEVGDVSLTGSDITFSIAEAADPSIAVEVGSPTITGSDVDFSDERYFNQATFSIAGKSIGLLRQAVVVSASPQIAGSDITLTAAATYTIGVDTAAPTIAGQSFTLNKTWATEVTAASFNVNGAKSPLQVTIDNGIVPAQAEFEAAGLVIPLDIGITVSPASFSIAGQDLDFGFDWTVEVEPEIESNGPHPRVEGQAIDLLLTFTLGMDFDRAEIELEAGEIDLYLGSGAPTTIKGYDSSWSIHGTASAPIAIGDADSLQVRSA